MVKRFRVYVTYDLYAQDEADATGQVLANRVAPEMIDTNELPIRNSVQDDYIPF